MPGSAHLLAINFVLATVAKGLSVRPNIFSRIARPLSWACGLLLVVLLTAPTFGQTSTSSLARYVPAEGLSVYVENDGFGTHSEAWGKSAASKLLNETSLGVLLEDLATQGINAMMAGGPPAAGRPSGAEVLNFVKQINKNGFAVGVFGRQPNAIRMMVVVRGAAKGELRQFFDKYADPKGPQGADAPAKVEKAGRALTPLGDGFWWAEKDDMVFASGDLADSVLAALDGKKPNATTHPIRAELVKAAAGVDQVALAFVDVKALPPIPPQAAALGLDGLERIEYRLGFQGEALVSEIAVVAPEPRSGILGLIDQPTFDKSTLPPLPEGLTGFTVLSVNFAKTYDKVVALMKAVDPRGGAGVDAFEKAVSDQFSLRLKEDFLAHLGPKLSLYMVESPEAGGNPVAAVMGGLFDVTLGIQTDDQAAIGKVLDILITVANQAVAANQRRPEFRKADGPNPGYVLIFPPEELKGPFTNMKPTVLLGKDRVVIATKPAAAEKAIALPKEGKGLWVPTGDFETLTKHLPSDLVFLNVSDPRGTVSTLMSNLPVLIQALNTQLAQARGPRGAPQLIQLDQAKIPKAEDLRSRLFPSSFALTVTGKGIRLVSREAIPSLYSPASSGILAGLLMPAVGASREAARRAQCVNNLKQMGLALHNSHSANNKFPRQAITDKDGKPLLSWRVAILPYLEQQELYNKFKLDEPWDSEHNKALIQEMPQVYVCPSRLNPEPGTTTYRGFVGNGAFWDAEKAVGLQDITDGTSNTLAIVEAKDAVPWTKPEDLTFDPQKTKFPFGAGSDHPGGFNALFGDGSVRFIKLSVDEAVLRALITRAGGEVIAADGF